jgi:methionine-rich copper-binding protein CopC
VLAGGLAVGIASPASAHPYLLRSDTVAGAVLPATPSEIHIFYTEGLDRPYCSVTIVTPAGQDITTRQVAAGQPTELAVAPTRSLTATGTYAVEWTAVGDDGHTVIGNFGFSVGHPTSNSAVGSTVGTTTGSASGQAGLQRLLRTVQPIATVIFAGFLLLAGAIAAARRRAVRARAISFAVHCGVVLALCGAAVADGGWTAFAGSELGHRLLVALGLSLLAVGVVVDRGALAAGRAPAGWRRYAGPALAAGLLVVLAMSGHADSQPESRRALAIVVY